MSAAPTSSTDPNAPGAFDEVPGGGTFEMDAEFDEATLAEAAASTPGVEVSWTQIWHAPVLLLGLGLLALGIYLALPDHEPPDLQAGMEVVETSLATGDLTAAQEQIDAIRNDPHFKSLPESADVHGRLAGLRGDWRYLDFRGQGYVDFTTKAAEENQQLIVADYAQAQRIGYALPAESTRRYAQTLARLNRPDEATDLVDSLPASQARDRAGVVRTLIEVQQDQPSHEAGHDRIGDLIKRFEAELRPVPNDDWRISQEVWATGLKVRRLLEGPNAQPEAALTLLNPALIKLTSRLPDPDRPVELAPLYLLMGRAQLMLDEHDEAAAKFRLAQSLVDPTDAMNADVLVGMGRIAMSQGAASDPLKRDEAEGFFTEAVRRYPTSDMHIEAMIRLADSQAWAASGSRMPEALANLDRAATQLLEQRPPWDPNRDLINEVAQRHAIRSNQRERFQDSLALLKIIERFNIEKPEPDVLHAFAATHEKLGEKALERANEVNPVNLKPGDDPTEKAWQAANQEAARHFLQAGEAYNRYALAVHEELNEDQLHGDALWNAASNFDKAQAWPLAIATYANFVEERREDGRRVRAQLQLGRALMADRQYDAAIERFQDLIERHPQSPVVTEAYVPLARCLAARDRAAEAERLLLSVVTDHPTITPESESYHDALIDLGTLYYRRGGEDAANYSRAIERLTEAVDRYGQTSESPRLRFMLGDSMRRSVTALDQELAGELPPKRQLAVQAERTKRLQDARVLFNQVKTELEQLHPDALTTLQKLHHRHSYFYEADCMYALGGQTNLEIAIELYSRAASRWSEHPSSLIAQVQIVNSYCKLEQFQAAAAAHRKAMYLLNRLPDEAFDDPTMPMTREHWEEWLRWSTKLQTLANAE